MGRLITNKDLKLIIPTPEQIQRAHEMAADMGLLKNSITKGKGSPHGFLGEILVAEALGARHENCLDWDLVTQCGITIDVKTKRCTTTPLLNYECSIAEYNPDQNCQYYVFTRILKNFKKAWILGGISKKDYFDKAVRREKGQRDPNDTPGVGFDFKASCYNFAIKDLKPINYSATA